MELPSVWIEKTVGRVGLGRKIRNSVLDILSLRCILDLHVQLSSRPLDV